MNRPVLVLVGPPGAGKSTVGSAVASRLGVAFRDTDTDVEILAGKSVADVFVQDGEPRFRDLERRAVLAALREHEGVLSLGGGAVLDPSTREMLVGHRVVLLDVDLASAVQRVGIGQGRPLVGLNPRAQLRQLLDQRRPFYALVTDRVVDTSALSPESVVEAVLRHL